MPRVKTPPLGWVLFGVIAVGAATYVRHRRASQEIAPFTVASCRRYQDGGWHMELTDRTGRRHDLGPDDVCPSDCGQCLAVGTVVNKAKGALAYSVDGRPLAWRDDPTEFLYLGAVAVVGGAAAELYRRRARGSAADRQ
jgi:hypothetical protein